MQVKTPLGSQGQGNEPGFVIQGESFGGIQAGEWHYLVPILNTHSGWREWVLRGVDSGRELIPARNHCVQAEVIAARAGMVNIGAHGHALEEESGGLGERLGAWRGKE